MLVRLLAEEHDRRLAFRGFRDVNSPRAYETSANAWLEALSRRPDVFIPRPYPEPMNLVVFKFLSFDSSFFICPWTRSPAA